MTELAIRAQRAAFNRAIADGDANAIAPILARDCVMLTGTDSAIISGRMAQVKLWRREFASPTRLVYARLPDEIILSPVEPIAMEHGQWTGKEAGSDSTLASGSYTAKWRRIGDDWVMEAEIFLTLA